MMISVLYIDDTPGLLREAKQFLERTGSFTVDTSLSGEDALKLLADTGYDIIIAAYQMAGMSSSELLFRIREIHASIPFIFMTGTLSSHHQDEALFLNADYIIQRLGSPIQVYGELALKINRAVKRRRREETLRDRRLKKRVEDNPFQEGAWVVNVEGTTLYGGAEIASILGYQGEEVWKRSFFSLMDDEKRAPVASILETAREQSIKDLELEFIGSDLLKRVIKSEEVRFWRDEFGAELFVLSGITEVTCLNHTKTILEQYTTLCDLLLNNLQGVLWRLNTVTMTFSYVSPSAGHFYGCSAGDLMEQHIDGVSILTGGRFFSPIIWDRAVLNLSIDAPPLFYSDFLTQYNFEGDPILTEIISEYYLNKDDDQINVRGFTWERSDNPRDTDECIAQEMNAYLATMRECAESFRRISKDDPVNILLDKIDLLEFALSHHGMWPSETREILVRYQMIHQNE